MSINSKETFQRFVSLLSEAHTLKQDIKATKEDVTFHKKNNVGGLDKQEVKEIYKAAAIYVKQNFHKQKAEFEAIVERYTELAGDE